MGYHAFLQGIFQTQELNLHLLCLLHWQVRSLPLVHLGKQVMQMTLPKVVACFSVVKSCMTLCDPMDCSMPQSSTISWSLLKLTSTGSVMPSNHLILRCPLLILFSVFPSTGVFSSESALHIRWPKYWSFSFNISLSNE